MESMTTLSSTTEPQCEQDDMTVDYIVFSASIAILLPFLTFGNVLTILAVLVTPQFRTLTYLHVANIAVADFLVGVGCALAGARSLTSLLCLIPDRVFIIVALSYNYFAATESLLGLLLLALERLVYIVYPFLYIKPATGRVFKCGIVLSWVLSLTMGALTGYFEQDFSGNCVDEEDLGRDHYHIAMPGVFLSASVVSSLCYIKIVLVSRQQQRRVAEQTTRPLSHVNFKSVGVFFVINTIFIVCWLPYVVVVVLWGCENSTLQTRAFLFMLGSSTSVCNVVIYSWKIKAFRKVCVRLLRCQCQHR